MCQQAGQTKSKSTAGKKPAKPKGGSTGKAAKAKAAEEEAKAAEDAPPPAEEPAAAPVAQPKESGKGGSAPKAAKPAKVAKPPKGKPAKAKAKEDVPPKEEPVAPAAVVEVEEPSSSSAPLKLTGKRRNLGLADALAVYKDTQVTAESAAQQLLCLGVVLLQLERLARLRVGPAEGRREQGGKGVLRMSLTCLISLYLAMSEDSMG